MPVKDPRRRQQAIELGLDPDQFDFIPNTPEPPAQSSPAPGPSSTAVGAGLRAAKRAALPTLGGIGATALAAAPFTGGTSLAGLLVPLAAGLGTGALLGYGQEKLLPLTPEEQAQRAADRAQHPYAQLAGELLPGLVAFRPSPGNILKAFQGNRAQMLNVGLGAGLGGVQEGVIPFIKGEEVDPGRLALAIAGGGLINEPNRIGRAIGFTPSTVPQGLRPTMRPEQPLPPAWPYPTMGPTQEILNRPVDMTGFRDWEPSMTPRPPGVGTTEGLTLGKVKPSPTTKMGTLTGDPGKPLPDVITGEQRLAASELGDVDLPLQSKLTVVAGDDGMPSIRPVVEEVKPNAQKEIKGKENLRVLTPAEQAAELKRLEDQGGAYAPTGQPAEGGLPLQRPGTNAQRAATEAGPGDRIQSAAEGQAQEKVLTPKEPPITEAPAPVSKPPAVGVESAPAGTPASGAATQAATGQAVAQGRPIPPETVAPQAALTAVKEGGLEFFRGEPDPGLTGVPHDPKLAAVLAEFNGKPDTPDVRFQMESALGKSMTLDELLAHPRNRQVFDLLQKLAQEKQVSVGVTKMMDAMGVSDLKNRIAAINPENLGGDTLAHEIAHIALKDMLSGTGAERNLAERGIAIFGNEEKLVQALGMRMTQLAENKVSGLTLRRFKDWLKDFVSAIKDKFGKGSSEDLSRLLARRILYGDVKPAGYVATQGDSHLRYQKLDAEQTLKVAAAKTPLSFVQKLVSGPLDMMLPEITKIANETNAKVGSALTEAFRSAREFMGIGHDAIAAARTLTRAEQDAALQYLYRKKDTMNGADTNAPDKVLLFEEKYLRPFYQRWVEAANSVGKQIVQDGRGRPIFETPYYVSEMMRPEVIEEISKQSAKGQRWLARQIEYMAQQTGRSAEVMQQEWKSWGKAHYLGQGRGQTDYGPLSEPAGIGVAPELRENNLERMLNRYNYRAARALGFHKAIHNDPAAAWYLGVNHDQLGKPIVRPDDIPPTASRYGDHPRVKEVMNLLRGEYSTIDRRIETLNQVARAGMLQTLTGLTDLMSFYVHVLPYTQPKQVVPAVMHALQNMRAGIKAGFETGVIQSRQLRFEAGQGMEGFTRVQEVARSLADGLNVITGRNHLEQWSRGLTMAWSDFLVKSNLGHAFNGQKQAIEFLNRFAGSGWQQELLPLVQAGQEVPQRVIDRISANVTEAAQGTYDPRGVPIQALKGVTSGFLSLAKWNIEKMNEFRRSVIEPAKRGNLTPLLQTTVGAFLGGSSIEAMREWITGRKPQNATWKEVIEAGGEGLEYRLMALASYAGWAGFAMDMLKQGYEVSHGKDAQGLRFPAVAMVQDFYDRTVQASEAMGAGENVVGTLALLGKQLMVDNIQMARVAVQRGDTEELERLNALRDLRQFREMEGRPQPRMNTRSNPFLNRTARQYQRSRDVGEIVSLAPQLVEQAFQRGGGDIERIGSLLRGYRTSGSDLMPSLRRSPLEFSRYANWLGRTQGEEAASGALQNYLQKQALDDLRSSLVPRL